MKVIAFIWDALAVIGWMLLAYDIQKVMNPDEVFLRFCAVTACLQVAGYSAYNAYKRTTN